MAGMVKILNIWNAGRVGTLLSRHFEGSRVIISTPIADPFEDGSDREVIYAGKPFLEGVLRTSREFDVLHVHALEWIVPLLRAKFPEKKLVFHHHGQNLRDDQKGGRDVSKQVDLTLYATPDLRLYLEGTGARYLPNPIDEELFVPTTGFMPIPKGPLWVECYTRHMIFRKDVLEQFPNATIWERHRAPAPYWIMPGIWTAYEPHISYKPDVDYQAMKGEVVYTLSDLEALHVGRDLFYLPNREWIRRFPEIHRTENVIKQLKQYYGEAGICV